MKGKQGFTLLEIFVVVFIIALLVAIAVPNYLKAQREVQKISCIANLKQIAQAIDRFVASENLSLAESVGFIDIVPAFLKVRPQCPSQGTYVLSTAVDNPTCSKAAELGHKLP